MSTHEVACHFRLDESQLVGLRTITQITKSGKIKTKVIRITENEWQDVSKEARLAEQLAALQRRLARMQQRGRYNMSMR